MWRSGFMISTSAEGVKSPALTSLGTLRPEDQGGGLHLGVQEAHHQLLQVQDDLHHVLLHPGNGGELVEDVLNVDAGDRGPGDGGEEDAAERVPQGDPKPPF
jgi:hypothetical protein